MSQLNTFRQVPRFPMSVAIKTSRYDKKAETRSRVLQAALDLFAGRGFQATSTKDIARQAGVAHGTVFTIMPTKERLALAAYDEKLMAIAATGFDGCRAQPTLLARFERVFEPLYDFYAATPEVAKVLVREQLFLADPAEKARHDRLLEYFLGGLAQLAGEAQASGELSTTVNLDDLTAGVFAVYLCFLLALLSGFYPSRDAHRAAYHGALTVLLAGNLQPIADIPA